MVMAGLTVVGLVCNSNAFRTRQRQQIAVVEAAPTGTLGAYVNFV